MTSVRGTLNDAKRVVVKVGSTSLLEGDERFALLARGLSALQASGRSVVLVSSGAIALGATRLGIEGRPRSIALLQAAAAAGQSSLMHAWERAFANGAEEVHVAQVLLTHADLADRDRYLNARAALDALLAQGAIPIINENDTVAVEEIRFGDNDQLAAMVATLVGADLLVLLTDVDGLLDAAGERVTVVADEDDPESLVRPDKSGAGVGGMGSKVEAARRATHRGVPVVIADARAQGTLEAVLAGEDVGTLFLPAGTKLPSRKHWIAYTLKAQGTIIVDPGAARALAEAKRSLLPAGVIGVRGDFEAGDAVEIVTVEGRQVARGLARYSTRDIACLAGARTGEIEARLGRYGGDEIVHRDDMVVH
ncbi:MAG: glutamate 5-kinase [Deltaproteobacteria bacterium]|nr:glutamate 5-kinase [Deltaproteobacteria bacterium]